MPRLTAMALAAGIVALVVAFAARADGPAGRAGRTKAAPAGAVAAPEVSAAPAPRAVMAAAPEVSVPAAAPVDFATASAPAVLAAVEAAVVRGDSETVAAALMAAATRADASAVLSAVSAAFAKADAAVAKAAVEAVLARGDAAVARAVMKAAPFKQWFDVYAAPAGSRMWWLLQAARERAEQGGDVEDLRRVYMDALAEWLGSDEDDT